MPGQGPRAFDPVVVGGRECDAWAAYYRHEWPRLLRASVSLVSAGFGMNLRRTLAGAWFVLRANQAWAPYPDNDADAARDYMRHFYALVVADGRLHLDPDEASRLELDWWRVHRMHQRENELTEDDLTTALVDLYCYVYGVAPDSISRAAHLRVVAMRLSDEWVDAGCDPASPLLAEERRTLVASYTSLRESIERADLASDDT
jgi:hypothetical protein